MISYNILIYKHLSYLSLYMSICSTCHFHKYLYHINMSLHISICSKCHFIQAFVLSSVTLYNYLCQMPIHISNCDIKCHVTPFNKTLTCLMYKTLWVLAFTYSMYSCIFKLNWNFLTHLFNQTTKIHHLLNGRPYVFLYFLIKFCYYYQTTLLLHQPCIYHIKI